jgi:hypothetical protein
LRGAKIIRAGTFDANLRRRNPEPTQTWARDTLAILPEPPPRHFVVAATQSSLQQVFPPKTQRSRAAERH